MQVGDQTQPFSGIHDQERGDQYDPIGIFETVDVQAGDQTQPSSGIHDREEPLNPTHEHANHESPTQDQIQPVKSPAVEQIGNTVGKQIYTCNLIS